MKKSRCSVSLLADSYNKKVGYRHEIVLESISDFFNDRYYDKISLHDSNVPDHQLVLPNKTTLFSKFSQQLPC